MKFSLIKFLQIVYFASVSSLSKVRERLAASKQTTQKYHMERFSLKKLNEIEGKEQYWVEISSRFKLWKT
jgi:hypothetical protein